MSAYCVTVADLARARFFNLKSVAASGFTSGPNLVELGNLVIPKSELRDRDVFTDTATGSSSSGASPSASRQKPCAWPGQKRQHTSCWRPTAGC